MSKRAEFRQASLAGRMNMRALELKDQAEFRQASLAGRMNMRALELKDQFEAVQIEKQIEQDAQRLIQEIPPHLLLLGSVILAVAIIDRLPIKLNSKSIAIATLISVAFSVSACASSVKTPEMPNQAGPTAALVTPGETAEATAGTTPEATAEATAEATTEVEQKEIDEMTAEMQSQLDEIFQDDPHLCKIYEEHKKILNNETGDTATEEAPTAEPSPTAENENPNYINPVNQLASVAVKEGLLSTSGDWTVNVDPESGELMIKINGETNYGQPPVYLTYGKDGSGFIFFSIDGAQRKISAADSISSDGPYRMNAYDKNKNLVGGVGADGRWKTVTELTENDLKRVVEVEVGINELASAILDGNQSLTEATAGWTVKEKLELSSKIIEIKEKQMAHKPVLYAQRTGRAAELGVEPEWRGLKLIENPDSVILDNWEGKIYNPNAKFWWDTINNENDTQELSMPDQLVEAVLDENGSIHYVDKNGNNAVFTGEFPSQEQIIKEMIEMHSKATGNTNIKNSIENGIVDVYAGILYESADITDIAWNIDQVAIPTKSFSILIPVWNEKGELLYMRKCYVLFTRRFYQYKEDAGGGVNLVRIDTSDGNTNFFGSGNNKNDLGEIVMLTGILDLESYSLSPYYETNNNVRQEPMTNIQDKNNSSDLLLIKLGELFVSASQ